MTCSFFVTVHLPDGFSSIKLSSYEASGAHFGQPGHETDLLYLAGLLALSIGGAGPVSLDGHLARGMRDADLTDKGTESHAVPALDSAASGTVIETITPILRC